MFRFCLLYNFDNYIFKKINGLPMESPLSDTLANIVMEEAETEIINYLTYCIKFYYRYIDDTLICLPKSKTNDVLNRFNNIHPKLVFMIEKSINDSKYFILKSKIIKSLLSTENQFGLDVF